MTYTLVTGNVLYPSQTPYQNISLTADITLNWPSSFIGGISTTYFTKVTPNADERNITLPDATLASPGNHLIFYNSSIYKFNILKNDSTLLLTVLAGQSVDFILDDTITSAGSWITIPYGGGSSDINAFQIISSDDSLIITNGNVLPPGAEIDLQLPPSISNLNKVNTTGFPVILSKNPLTWETAEITAGDNITIDNGDGVAGDPVIHVNSNLIGITSLEVGKFAITGSTISATDSNTNLIFSTFGTGELNLNNILIDTSGNINTSGNIEANSIFVTTFRSPNTPVAWAVFNDTSGTIVIEDNYNVSSIEHVTDIFGNPRGYRINFTNYLLDINYGVTVDPGTDGTVFPPIIHGRAIHSTRDEWFVEVVFIDVNNDIVGDLPLGATVLIMSSR